LISNYFYQATKEAGVRSTSAEIFASTAGSVGSTLGLSSRPASAQTSFQGTGVI